MTIDGNVYENWTSHDVVLVDKETGTETVIPMEEQAPIRMATIRKRISKYLFSVSFTVPSYIPEIRDGIYLIVSSPVKMGMPGRPDLVTPNDLVRDCKGRPIACRSFAI